MNNKNRKPIQDDRIPYEDRVRASKNRAILRRLMALNPMMHTYATIRNKILLEHLSDEEVEVIKNSL